MDTTKIRLVAPYTVEGITNCTIKEAYLYLRKCKVVTVDTETTTHPLFIGIGSGLDPYTSMLVSLQIGDADRQFVIDTRYIDIGLISNILKSKSIVKLGVNLKFDYSMIRRHLGIRMANLFDIGLAELILTNGLNKKWSLAAIALKYLNIDLNTNQLSLFENYVSKNTVKEYEKLKFDHLTLELIKYSAADVYIPSMAYPKILTEIRKDKLSKTIKIENQFIPVLGDMELKGIKLDPEKWLALLVNNKKALADTEHILNQYLIHNGLEEFMGMNWNSSKQVGKVFKLLDIPISVVDKAKSIGQEKVYKDTVGQAHIKKFKNKFDILPAYLYYKNLHKAVSTYGFKFLSNVNPISNRVHTNIRQIIHTGRVASSEPNMQNIPAINSFRECFIAEPGKKLVDCDYDGQESRILADLSKDEVLLDIFTNGDGDFHSVTAKSAFGEATPENRPMAKMLNFAIPYGASSYKVADSAQVSLKTAEEWIAAYHKAYPKVAPYFEKVIKQTLSKGFILVDTYTKRRTYLEDFEKFLTVKEFINHSKTFHPQYKIPSKVWSIYFKFKGSYERNAQNYPIQGCGGSMTKIAAIKFKVEMERRKWLDRAEIIMLVHDQIVIECDEAIANTVAKCVQKCMLDAGKLFVKIPMTATPKQSYFWIK